MCNLAAGLPGRPALDRGMMAAHCGLDVDPDGRGRRGATDGAERLLRRRHERDCAGLAGAPVAARDEGRALVGVLAHDTPAALRRGGVAARGTLGVEGGEARRELVGRGGEVVQGLVVEQGRAPSRGADRVGGRLLSLLVQEAPRRVKRGGGRMERRLGRLGARLVPKVEVVERSLKAEKMRVNPRGLRAIRLWLCASSRELVGSHRGARLRLRRELGSQGRLAANFLLERRLEARRATQATREAPWSVYGVVERHLKVLELNLRGARGFIAESAAHSSFAHAPTPPTCRSPGAGIRTYGRRLRLREITQPLRREVAFARNSRTRAGAHGRPEFASRFARASCW